jgi:hypothetical protein
VTKGFWDIFRTNARPADPDPPLAPEPEPEPEGGRLWRAERHVCTRPHGGELGLGDKNRGSIWRCPCGQRHRWVGSGWVEVGVSLDDDADVLAGEKAAGRGR